MFYINKMIEGSLEVKLPTILTDEKQRWEVSEKRREDKRRRKKIGRSKSNLAKAAGAKPSGQMRDYQLHAGAVRSTFPSQIVQGTSA